MKRAGSRSRMLWAMVRADFLERVRRYSFLVTLGFAVYLGYAVFSGKITMQLEHYRGVANSAWVGAVVGLVGSVFLGLVGFYVVKNSIQRDRETRVGRILAATPMSKSFYTVSKWLSNFAVLAAMIGVLAVGAVVMQLVHGDGSGIRLFALLGPLLVFSLCSVSMTAALAVLFETIPGLRGGLGNVVYFFLWVFMISLSVTTLEMRKPATAMTTMRDYTGIATISGQMQAQLYAMDKTYEGGSSFTAGGEHAASKRFVWEGLKWTPVIVLSRVVWLGVSLGLVLLAAVFFDRFDLARGRLRPGKKAMVDGAVEAAGLSAARRMMPQRLGQGDNAVGALKSTGSVAGEGMRGSFPFARLRVEDDNEERRANVSGRFGALVVAELRLMLKGRPWWWYLVAAGLFVGCLSSPLSAARSGLILAAWLWPILVWSQMGTREAQFSTRALVFSAPRAFPRQLLAAWAAGMIVALLTGGGLGVRLLVARDWSGLAAWGVAALFIPALALASGVLSESRKPFEALYVAWWYIGPAHAMREMDFIGVSAQSSTPGRFLVGAVGLVVVACVWRKMRLAAA